MNTGRKKENNPPRVFFRGHWVSPDYIEVTKKLEHYLSKNKRKLLKIINSSRLLKFQLKVDPDLFVYKITPNSIHQVIDSKKKIYKATFFLNNRVAETLIPINDIVSIISDTTKKRRSKDILFHVTGEKRNNKYPQILLTTTNFGPDSGGSGYLDVSNSATWSGAHDATSGTATAGDLNARSSKFGSNYYISRDVLPFDTSSLPNSATISSATLGIYTGGNSSTDGDSLRLVTYTPTSETAINGNDYNDLTTTQQATSDMLITGMTINSYNYFTLNATGISNISLTGWSNFARRSVRDINNSAPTGLNQNAYDGTAEANPPILSVTYTGGSFSSTQTETLVLVDTLVKAPSRSFSEVVTLVSNAIKTPIRLLKERIQLANEGSNLIYNPGFENDLADAPDGWSNFNAPANITRGSVNTVKRSGSNSWHIGTTNGSTADAGISQNEFSGRPGPIVVTPNTVYRISGYIKTALTTGQAHIHIKLFDSSYGNQADYDTDTITGEVDWTLNDYVFTTGASHTRAEVWLAFGSWGAAANGDAWFDDLSLATYTSSDTLITLRTAIKLLSETVVLVETFIKTTDRVFSEVVTLAETFIKNTILTFEEVVTLVETFLKNGIKNFTETIALVEDFIAGTIIVLSERIVIAETFIKGQGKVLTETIHLIQTSWRSFARGVATWVQQVGNSASWNKKTDPDSDWTQEHGDSHT